MDITPFVYPPNDQEGVEVSPIVSALFNTELDAGTIVNYNAFLIKKSSEYTVNSVKPVEAKISLQRINLLDLNLHTGKDYGITPAAGTLYRSKIVIEPLSPLEPHTEYSVILSKEIGSNTVFDVVLGVSNIAQDLLLKGPFTGLSADTYTVTIQTSGTASDAIYKWKRSSDNHEETGLVSKKRFIEIDKGLFLKFNESQYVAGDTFAVKVKPISKINQIISWSFSTGDASYMKPDDERSGSVVQLPINDPAVLPTVGSNEFGFLSVDPYDGKTMVKVGSKGVAVVNGIVVTTILKTAALNGKKVKLIAADIAESIYELSNDIIIEVLETTTKQQVVDLINGSTIAIKADTSTPTALAGLHNSGVLIKDGEAGGFISFTFNKPIDASKMNASKIKATFESLTEIEQGDLDCTYEITDNVLKIQF